MTSARYEGNERAIVIMGGGGHAAVVADAARLSGWNVIGFVTDKEPSHAETQQQQRAGLVWLNTIDNLADVLEQAPPYTELIAAVGDSALREKWIARGMSLGAEIATVVHPSATIAESVSLKHGTFVGPHAVIAPRATINEGVIINTSAVVEHDCEIGAFAHIAPGAVLTGGAIVGRMVMIGARAVVVPERIIGDGTFVAAGAVVTTNIPPGIRVAGCPAKPIGVPTSKTQADPLTV